MTPLCFLKKKKEKKSCSRRRGVCRATFVLILAKLHFSFLLPFCPPDARESKIGRHLNQWWYLRANCHSVRLQNAYYGRRASIWNDCTLEIQWWVSVAVATGWASLVLTLSLRTKPTILPRLHSLTPHRWLTTKYRLTPTNLLTSASQIVLSSACGYWATGGAPVTS